ncbi:MAG TPA: aminoglycoside phosphotransferase family protein [Bacteroidales bacterium]|nr:hypothetical protein [Bacteroidota bacterium]HJN05492.1 aminoglycoside phosphotransferase family protein [Bacteroidales bacterium]
MISSKILYRFFPDCEITDVVKYGDGHINNTYLISTNKRKFILQQVNRNVFNINNLVHNYINLIRALSEQGALGKFFPIFIPDNSGSIHYVDTAGSAWRANEFIEDYSTYEISPSTSITENAGKAMGKFQLFLTKLNSKDFKDTIPDFHNPLRRLNEFQYALKNADVDLKKVAENEINFALDNKSIAKEMSYLLKSTLLPERITHNDTKLENFLFSTTSHNTYVIDLDTVMSGSLLFDFGDMVRSITSIAKEDEKDLSKVTFRMDHFEALCRGYLGELKNIITTTEKEQLLSGALCIIYIQGLRFLTDYISGNKYYKVAYPTHNLIRCRTQFKLLEDILMYSDELTDKIYSVLQ